MYLAVLAGRRSWKPRNGHTGRDVHPSSCPPPSASDGHRGLVVLPTLAVGRRDGGVLFWTPPPHIQAQVGTSSARGRTLGGFSVKKGGAFFEALSGVPRSTGSIDLRVPAIGIRLKRSINCRDMVLASIRFIALISPSLPFRASSLSANRFHTIPW